MASGQQHWAYDLTGRNYAYGSDPGILEYVPGGGSVGGYFGGGFIVLEPDFPVSGKPEAPGKAELEYCEFMGQDFGGLHSSRHCGRAV